MKNKLIIVGFLMLLLLGTVFATVEENLVEEDNFQMFTDGLQSELENLVGKELPGPLQPFVNDESLQIDILLDSQEVLNYYIIVNSGIISQAGSGLLEAPGYSIMTTQGYIEENQGEAFGTAIREGLSTGEISYSAEGFWRKMKLSMMLAAVDIAALFQ